MNKDFTVIFLTANMIPDSFAAYQRQVLIDSIKDAPLISVSRKPIDFGLNLLDEEKKSTDNIYRQMLRAAKLASTKYVIVAEDDTLYNEEHFQFFRPRDNAFGYNRNRATLFTWGTPVFHWRNRLSNCSLIAPRELLIESLEERYSKWPDGIPEHKVGELGRMMVDNRLGVKIRRCEEKYSKTAIIQFNHAFSSEERQLTQKKSYGQIQAYDMPYWGKAEDMVKKFR
jgi:hypothetical protein